MTGDPQRGVHAELYVRSLAPRAGTEGQAAVLETLDELSDSDVLVDYEVHVCGECLPATPAATATAFGAYLLDRVAIFSEWAQRNDRSLERVFDRQRIDSSITSTTHEVIRFPMMALAEYEGTALRFVAPCSSDGETVTVRDRLESLLAGDPTRLTPLLNAYSEEPSADLAAGSTDESDADSTDSKPLVR